jgi:hypothetical protein
MSNDGSQLIARLRGCTVRAFNTRGQFDDYHHKFLRNECWKHIKNEWIIVCDMDEWLCVTLDELIEEDRKGTTLLKVKGYDMIGDSKDENLGDINLHTLMTGNYSESENKPICFKAGPIREMFYEIGGHRAFPEGQIVTSEREYILKHMNYLGLPFKLMRNKIRFDRSHRAREVHGLCFGYTTSNDELVRNHESVLSTRTDLSDLIGRYTITS